MQPVVEGNVWLAIAALGPHGFLTFLTDNCNNGESTLTLNRLPG